MPVITIKMFEGRTLEQKRAICKRITEVIVEEANTTPEQVSIHIEDMRKDELASGGILFCDK